jgi:hypothetical protein
MAYVMVKTYKLQCCPMTTRGFTEYPILSSKRADKSRVLLRHLAFDIVISLGWEGGRIMVLTFDVTAKLT